MSKRIISFILVFLLALSLFACSSANNTDTEKNTEKEAVSTNKPDEPSSPPEKDSSPALYKVTDSEGHTAWLFGSIHVGRDDFYPLPDYVMNAYNTSDSLAVEFDVIKFENEADTSSIIEILAKMIYSDGTTIKDHVSEEVYNKCVEIFEENDMYNALLDYYKPCFWSQTIDSLSYEKMELDLENGIDKYFLKAAKKDGKEILEVESAAIQYNMYANFSPELQLYLLESSIESYTDTEASIEELDQMQDIWVEGDPDTFAEYLSIQPEFESEEEKELYDEYTKALITDRNVTMTDFAESALKSGKQVFICVGAGHVMGDGSISDLLAERGYTVEIVK